VVGGVRDQHVAVGIHGKAPRLVEQGIGAGGIGAAWNARLPGNRRHHTGRCDHPDRIIPSVRHEHIAMAVHRDTARTGEMRLSPNAIGAAYQCRPSQGREVERLCLCPERGDQPDREIKSPGVHERHFFGSEEHNGIS
jgi:hypothetical protein